MERWVFSRRVHDNETTSKLSKEPVYEIIAPKTETMPEKRKEDEGRRPHSAPSKHPDNLNVNGKEKCKHNKKLLSPLEFIEDSTVMLLIQSSPTGAKIFEPENNNKVTIKLDALNPLTDTSNTESSAGSINSFQKFIIYTKNHQNYT